MKLVLALIFVVGVYANLLPFCWTDYVLAYLLRHQVRRLQYMMHSLLVSAACQPVYI